MGAEQGGGKQLRCARVLPEPSGLAMSGAETDDNPRGEFRVLVDGCGCTIGQTAMTGWPGWPPGHSGGAGQAREVKFKIAQFPKPARVRRFYRLHFTYISG
jgi:hypothetical protein